MKENYQKKLDQLLGTLQKEGQKPRLLLHCCCAPCSSYVLEYLNTYFDITAFYDNPNIAPESEFRFRVEELSRLLREMPLSAPVALVEGEYDTKAFYTIAKGHETDPEGGERCFACYRLRLEHSAKYAKDHGFDYFTTTLSISPYKNAEKLNQIGAELAEQYGVAYLFSDFKKKSGYLRSCQLSEEYQLYRQDYCGCIYSRAEAESRRKSVASQAEKSFSSALELRKMNCNDIVEQWKYVTALPADENGLTNAYEGVSFEEYRDKVLPELMMHEHPVNMPDWFVPGTYYYLWDGNTLVGEYRIRHYLTDALKTGAGHIGYSIKKELRGKGYGTKGLALALDLARKIIPEDEIYLRVQKTNLASYRAIVKNGAYVTGEDETHYFLRVKK